MTWKCGKISVDFDVSRWVFPETHVEDNSLEDERAIASKQIKSKKKAEIIKRNKVCAGRKARQCKEMTGFLLKFGSNV